MNNIGKNIKSQRQKQGWNQGEVARRLKISIPAYSKIETCISDINISRLTQIATVFGVEPIELLEGKYNESASILTLELESCKSSLTEALTEISNLQRKIIKLLDENRELASRLRAN